MQKFKLLNNIFGWLSFVFAAIVYGMTMESSGSFWDCGEFISGCFKLQVVHPPGAPFFLMLGRIFTLFSGADPLQYGGAENVALTVNFMSALATAGAVMFTFWTTTAFARKYLVKDGVYTDGKTLAIIGAGIIAATACTFLDSLWFSAVEGEVYALSQFFMSFVVWGIMKWDADDSPYADHWLILIAYMTGLSIGVHLLSLLALPALALVYYYKRYKNVTVTGWIAAVAIGFVILGVYMKFIISYTQAFLASFEKLFVNSFSMPFNSGAMFFMVALALGLAGGIYYSHRANKRGLNVILLCFAFSYIGYMSYMMVPIRAIANPPINMNRPTDPFSLKSYVDREQYGDRPLLFGPDYTATRYDIEKYVNTGERWDKNPATGKYDFTEYKKDYQFSSKSKMLFPRMGFWQEENKKAGYRAWLDPEYNVVNAETGEVNRTFPPSGLAQAQEYAAGLNKAGGNGNFYVKDAVSFADNIRYFFKYQVGYMYFRYFMWNFAGRQNDIQGTYGNDDGRWISGIPFIDNMGTFFLPEWPQEKLTPDMLANKAHNKFYLLPFIIGMVGLIFTLMKDDKTFLIILVLWGTTGLLQIVYQNEPPIEPRERDYAIAGSFIMYTIWMGFGLIAIFDWLRKKMAEVPSAAIAFALCVAAPVLMGMQGWDDHNRHGRYTARDFAICYLESCAPNAVIFTQGDNDTYPLWYAQETEGIRPDIRIINLSLLGVDWYINQLRYKTNEAAPLKITFTREQLLASNRDYVQYKADPRIPQGTPIELKKVMQFIASEAPQNKVMYQSGETENYLPVRSFFMDIDLNKAREMNMVSADEDSLLVPRMEWTVNKDALVKNDLLTLDIIANNFMERPIYFAVSVAPDAYLSLDKYFQVEGLAYRLVPKLNPSGSHYTAPPRTDVMYTNMMTKFKFGGIPENRDIYLDENVLRMTQNIRGNFGKLAEALLAKGENAKAAEVIDYSLKQLPVDRVPHTMFDLSYPKIYYQAGQNDKGRKLLEELFANAKAELDYYKSVYEWSLKRARDNGDLQYLAQLQQGAFIERSDVRQHLYVMQEMTANAKQYESAEFTAKLQKEFDTYKVAFYQGQPGQLPQ